MQNFERPAIALIAALLSRKIRIGTKALSSGYANVTNWTKRSHTQLTVNYISGEKVDIYNPLNELKIVNIGDFAEDRVRLKIYQKMYSSEITLTRIRFNDGNVEGEVKKESGEIYPFTFEIDRHFDVRMEDKEAGTDEYKGKHQYQIDF